MKYHFVKKHFLNDNEIIYKVKGFDFYIKESELDKMIEVKSLINKNQYPLDENNEYKKWYEEHR